MGYLPIRVRRDCCVVFRLSCGGGFLRGTIRGSFLVSVLQSWVAVFSFFVVFVSSSFVVCWWGCCVISLLIFVVCLVMGRFRDVFDAMSSTRRLIMRFVAFSPCVVLHFG